MLAEKDEVSSGISLLWRCLSIVTFISLDQFWLCTFVEAVIGGLYSWTAWYGVVSSFIGKFFQAFTLCLEYFEICLVIHSDFFFYLQPFMYGAIPIIGWTVVNVRWQGYHYLSLYQILCPSTRACMLCNETGPMLHPSMWLVWDDLILCCLCSVLGYVIIQATVSFPVSLCLLLLHFLNSKPSD